MRTPHQRRIEALLTRIQRTDRQLRAFLTLDRTGALAAAAKLDRGDSPKAKLRGTPIAIKDLTDTAGLRTTYGSLLFAEHRPEADDLIVSRLRAAGAIILGKTMTPEFGFGALCANRLGGPTANPWDLSLTSGGSSGGSAAAVAAGLVPLAHGTDFGGSVRTPASFCGIASIRPTPGALPDPKRGLGYDMLATTGFLARDVATLRRALRVAAGPHPADPLSRDLPASRGAERPLRIATTEDFGAAPVSRDVRRRFAAALAGLPIELGQVAPAHPDCADAFSIFFGLRPALIARAYAGLAAKHAQAITPTIHWWIKAAAGVSAEAFLAAEAARTALARRFVAFFERFDVLIAPAASLMPWPNHQAELLEIDGKPLETIADYLAITFFVSLAGCPVVTLPTPGHGERLPFGVQLIGAPWSDLTLLEIAGRFEREAGFRFRRPPALPRPKGGSPKPGLRIV